MDGLLAKIDKLLDGKKTYIVAILMICMTVPPFLHFIEK